MAACATPYMVRPTKQASAFYNGQEQDGNPFPVPCGKCPECLTRRASGWSFRLMQEEKVASSAQFITLTYDTAHVPITAGRMSLRKRDVQLFFKRLRKSQEQLLRGTPTTATPDDRPIKYYAVGEYGTKTFRPHYHILLFNADRSLIQSAWQLGSTHYGLVSGASVGYTLKYMCKPRRIPQYIGDQRVPEFSLMSKGLGKSYLTDKIRDWHEKT